MSFHNNAADPIDMVVDLIKRRVPAHDDVLEEMEIESDSQAIADSVCKRHGYYFASIYRIGNMLKDRRQACLGVYMLPQIKSTREKVKATNFTAKRFKFDDQTPLLRVRMTDLNSIARFYKNVALVLEEHGINDEIAILRLLSRLDVANHQQFIRNNIVAILTKLIEQNE